MKNKLKFAALVFAFLSTIHFQLSTLFAQGTAFTYQGQLNEGTNPANGVYDFRFGLYSNSAGGLIVAGPLIISGVAVSNGSFIVTLDYGNVFDGTPYWLQISARTNGTTTFTALSPRQQLTPTPYAIFAEGANAAGLSGTIPSASLAGAYGAAVNFTNPANVFAGGGSGLSGVNAATLSGLAASNFWTTVGNAGTSPTNGNFLGTTDDQPLELHVNGSRALRLEPIPNASNISNMVNVVGGSPINSVTPGYVGATIAGGGSSDYIGLTSLGNSVSGDFGSIGGGGANVVSATFGTVAGGRANYAGGINVSTIGGGEGNNAAGPYSTIGGGFNNFAGGSLFGGYTAVAGGASNNITSVGIFSFIGGGQGNTVNQGYGTIGGGLDNAVNNAFTTVAGGGNNTADGPGTTVSGGYANLASSVYSTVGGGVNNTASGTSQGYATVSGGDTNVASGDYATVSGGQNNNAKGMNSSIGGGWINIASGSYAAIGGGSDNKAPGLGATVGGGSVNTAGGALGYATVGGGYGNTASGTYATVAGGAGNNASGDYATVGGGDANTAGGSFSFAAGLNAHAKHDGSFVWADYSSSYLTFSSTASNVFFARCTGGVRFVTAIDSLTGADTAGVKVGAGGTSWSAVCDRNAKKNFQPVDTVAVLDKLATVPIQQWNYKWEADTATPNLGPMAQDFKAAFYPGRDDKSISTLEFDGVELAAIQGLNRKLEETRAENAELKREIEELKRLILSDQKADHGAR